MKRGLHTFLLAASYFVPACGLAQIETYDRILENLSEPAATRWQHFAAPYFSTNEKLLNRFYSRFDNLGGVTVGVSFQQNLSLLVHVRPKLCVIFDYNPGVTEILVPFMGQLIADSPRRQDFLSTLLGANITAEETKQLLEGKSPVADVLSPVLERTDPVKRSRRLEALRELLRTKYLARLPSQASPYIRTQAAKWVDTLENEELLTGTFFSDAIAAYRSASSSTDSIRQAGWLSTEENYALVRDYWISGRIIGITGDISGPSVDKLSAYLRERRLQVTALYLSNVGLSIEGHFPETWFRDLYAKLGRLPVTPQTLTLIAQGPWQLTGYVRTLGEAQWVYQVLADVPEQTVIRLQEAPLEILVQQGTDSLLPALRQGLTTLKAPPACFDLLEEIRAHRSRVRALTPKEFSVWSHQRVPALDTDSGFFKTMMVTLAESHFLHADTATTAR